MKTLRQALRIPTRSQIRLAFVGAGGKTIALFRLAKELEPPVLVTTSTHLGAWQLSQAGQHIPVNPPDFPNLAPQLNKGVILLTGPKGNQDRVSGLDEQSLARLLELADHRQLPLLIEADGSRQRPLKAPAEHEPAIPPWVQQVVVVAGLSGLGKPLNADFVHRPERFARCGEAAAGAMITEEMLVRVLLNEQGGQKNIPTATRKIALLNQADSPDLVLSGLQMSQDLLKGFQAVVVTSLLDSRAEEDPVHAVVEPIAGVILAAGGASRYGAPKTLVDWHGRPLVRHIAEMALAGGLWPVVVIAGAVLEPLQQALEGLPVQVIANEQWQEGQSTSVKAGIRAIHACSARPTWPNSLTSPDRPGACLFLLADQPFVSVDLIRKLREEHARTLSPVIAPQAGGRRANPVLFDRVTFDDFAQISGDAGGRVIFERYPPRLVPWPDERLLLDLDTPQDYEALKQMDRDG